MKTCTKCKVEQTLENYAKEARSKDGLRSSCKTCHAAWMKAYNERNAESNRIKQKARDEKRKPYSRHGITAEQHETLLKTHAGMCWTCQKSPATVVDHDHSCCAGSYSCGKCVRGLLCGKCNMALGLVADDPDTLVNMLNYVST